MNLAETQALFFKLVTGQHSGQEVSYAPFSGSAELPVEQRVEIYANMYRWRLVDAILADFPKLAQLLDEEFLPVCSEYLRHYPSENPDIGKIGRCLPQFLKHCQAGNSRPDLGDLAALEWARCEVFCETDALAVDRSQLTSISPQAFVSVRLSFVPALRVLDFEHRFSCDAEVGRGAGAAGSNSRRNDGASLRLLRPLGVSGGGGLCRNFELVLRRLGARAVRWRALSRSSVSWRARS